LAPVASPDPRPNAQINTESANQDIGYFIPSAWSRHMG
jgi:hypothetical protein